MAVGDVQEFAGVWLSLQDYSRLYFPLNTDFYDTDRLNY